MITYTYDLNMVPGGGPLMVHVGQYDSDFVIVFNLYASTGTFNVESGTTAEVRGTKRDGNGYSASATIDIANKRVTVTGNQQMTAVAGQQNFELVLLKSNKPLSTANFILDVERAAMDADTIQSDTVLMELQAIIDGAETATDAATAAAASAAAAAESARTLTIDATLTQTGQAADAKKVGDEITDLKGDLEDIAPGVWSDTAKDALLACFAHVAWIDDNGQDYYDALETALYPDEPHAIHGWLYRFNDSLISDGDKDFDFLGTALYSTGVNGKAFYHKVATEGTASTDPLGIYATGLTDVPDLSGDFTISVWHKSITNRRGHVFGAVKYNSTNRIPITKGTVDEPTWTDHAYTDGDVADTYRGLRLMYSASSNELNISMFLENQNIVLFASFILPNAIQTTDWHHHAITRSNGVIRYFFDGELIWHVNSSDPIVFPDQICLGNGFGNTDATKTQPSQTPYGDMYDDLYIAEFAKWTSDFDPTEITY